MEDRLDTEGDGGAISHQLTTDAAPDSLREKSKPKPSSHTLDIDEH